MEPAVEADVDVPTAKLVVVRELDRTKLWLKMKGRGGEPLFHATIHDGFDQIDGLDLWITDKQAEAELDPAQVEPFLDAVADLQDALLATRVTT